MTMKTNNTTLLIPEGTKYIDKEAYLNNPDIEEIIFPESVEEISQGAFARMKSLKKVIFSSNLRILRESAFANCPNLEEVIFHPNCPLTCFDKGIFSYCKKLKKINIPNNVQYILDYALFNCQSLTDLDIPENVTSLGIYSLSGTNLKEISISKNILTINQNALSNIQSLERFNVSPGNTTYTAINNGTLLVNKLMRIIVQYAINAPHKIYTVPAIINEDTLCGLDEHAFAGARHLEELTIYSCQDFIGMETFKNCNKLKTLNIKLHSSQSSHVWIVMPLLNVDAARMPFKEINYEDGILSTIGTSNIHFPNLTKICLPNDLREIGNEIYHYAPNLKEVHLPKSLASIMPNSFHDNTILYFANGIKVKGKDFSSFRSSSQYKILTLKDGTYYINHATYGEIKVDEDELINLSTFSRELINEPEKIIDYLLNMYFLFLKAEEDSYYKLAYKHIFADGINYHNPLKFIEAIIRRKAQYENPLLNGILMNNLKIDEATLLIKNYSLEIETFFKYSNALTISLEQFHDNVTGLISYCNALKKYQQKDPFLYNMIFLGAFNNNTADKFIKNFDSHIKRMIIASKALETSQPNSAKQNIHDLYVLASMLGAYSNNSILKQRSTNFITEKICADYVSDNQKNEYQIAGDDIHSIFHSVKLRDDYNELSAQLDAELGFDEALDDDENYLDISYDHEFIDFFIENYQELLQTERNQAGIIARIYNAFPDISKSSSSHKAHQRHLKVTVEKCTKYLAENKYAGVTDENKHIALFISPWFDRNEDFQRALLVLEEAKEAPRNIFSPVKIKINEKAQTIKSIFDNNPLHDLKEELREDFSYEWLYKQALENLVLGKYCNCCAHIAGGQGSGIMRASMVSNSIQNLVIRNKKGEIIAKATIYVNREKRYAIFNTLEVNIRYKDPQSIQNIYNAFMRGAHAFMDTYNQNNHHAPIETITIGESRNNALLIMKSSDIHKPIKPFRTFNWGKYSFNETDYYADAKEAQIVVISK